MPLRSRSTSAINDRSRWIWADDTAFALLDGVHRTRREFHAPDREQDRAWAVSELRKQSGVPEGVHVVNAIRRVFHLK
jgi:hypothetical protein